jgi:DNA-binding IclR family transcriptional regulator
MMRDGIPKGGTLDKEAAMASVDGASQKSLVRAVAILECFRPDQPQVGISEIARQLRMSRSTVGRIVTNLHALGVLSQDAVSRRYMMGSKVLAWSAAYVGQWDVVNAARPALAELHRITCETVSIYVRDGTERVCIEHIESPERVRVVIRRGERMPLHAGSSGKALLAYAPESLVKQVLAKPLPRMTDRTITSRKELLKELEAIRARGYATSHGERFEDALGLAAPIFDSTGWVVAVLNVAGPNYRFTDASVAKYAPKVIQLADQVSLALGYRRSLALSS